VSAARKAKRAAVKPIRRLTRLVSVPEMVLKRIGVAQIRLRRAQDVLTCLAFAADEGAELDFGPVAIAARDQIDQALDGLSSLMPKRKGLDDE
jgi:hypothetical protein